MLSSVVCEYLLYYTGVATSAAALSRLIAPAAGGNQSNIHKNDEYIYNEYI